MQDLVADAWLFNIPVDTGGALSLLEGLSLSLVDTDFVLRMVPQILTIAFLALLTQSMSLSALMASGNQDLDTSSEIEDMGGGNLLCAVIASPPGSTDVIGSTLYEEFGASSRWMPIISSGVCLVMAVFGSAIIPWMPKLLVGSTVFPVRLPVVLRVAVRERPRFPADRLRHRADHSGHGDLHRLHARHPGRGSCWPCCCSCCATA